MSLTSNDLMQLVVPKDRQVLCSRCREWVTPFFAEAGPHIRADCPKCEKYVKFVRQVSEHPRHAEPELYEDSSLPW